MGPEIVIVLFLIVSAACVVTVVKQVIVAPMREKQELLRKNKEMEHRLAELDSQDSESSDTEK